MTPDPAGYVEGERVFGPPLGTYDADWVAAAACEADPSLPRDRARLLAGRAWDLLRGGVPAGDLSDALGDPRVAQVALDFCASYGVELPG